MNTKNIKIEIKFLTLLKIRNFTLRNWMIFLKLMILFYLK